MNCCVYRHYDSDGVLLYVGQSVSPLVRLQQHEAGSHWADQIATVKIERFSDEYFAIAAEGRAIREEKPKYNIRRRDWDREGKAAAKARGVRMGPKHRVLDCPLRFARFVDLWKSGAIADGGMSTRAIVAVLNAVPNSKLPEMQSHTSYANWKARGFPGFNKETLERV